MILLGQDLVFPFFNISPLCPLCYLFALPYRFWSAMGLDKVGTMPESSVKSIHIPIHQQLQLIALILRISAYTYIKK